MVKVNIIWVEDNYSRLELHINIKTQKTVSIAEANQNFSKFAKIASEEGSVIVMRNNKSEYILLKINNNQNYETADSVEIDT